MEMTANKCNLSGRPVARLHLPSHLLFFYLNLFRRSDDDDDVGDFGDGHGLRAGLDREVEVALDERGRLVPIPHRLSFDQGVFVLVRAIEVLREARPDDCLVVGISGPTGSGKSLLAAKVAEVVGGTTLGLTAFLKADGGAGADDNHVDPNRTDFSALQAAVDDLRKGRTVELVDTSVTADAKVVTGAPVPFSVGPTGLLIIEGVHALHASIRGALDVAVSVTGGVHLDLLRRIIRDTQRFAGSIRQADLVERVAGVVFPSFKAYVEPSLATADIAIVSSFNPLINLQDPLFVCKVRRRRA